LKWTKMDMVLLKRPELEGGRSSNYTIAEDVLLCKTWLKIGMDSAVGTDQTSDTYWVRMKEYFDANNLSGNELIKRSLQSHCFSCTSFK
jgi:hypothetical protein